MVAELALDRVNGWARSKEVVEEHLPRLAPLTVIPTHDFPDHAPRPRGGHGRVVLAPRERQGC